MTFTKRLHAGIAAGEITCTVRVWHAPRVKLGGRYAVADGAVEVTRIREIGWDDITPDLARRSGFAGVVDLLKIARHGSGQRVFLIDFAYRPDAAAA
ncbi:MAG TPA: ASCH domain-containing protein [Caulobacteraceae bacterium]|jgi:hypothetical protein|nr:ASCH domain-containing protein [Caulobacteraceae bacterium]